MNKYCITKMAHYKTEWGHEFVLVSFDDPSPDDTNIHDDDHGGKK